MRIPFSCGLALALLALATQNAPAQFMDKKVLTLVAARGVVAAAEAEAARNHPAGVIALVDDGGGRPTLSPADPAPSDSSIGSSRSRSASISGSGQPAVS
jgi:glc operon protein GlcG